DRERMIRDDDLTNGGSTNTTKTYYVGGIFEEEVIVENGAAPRTTYRHYIADTGMYTTDTPNLNNGEIVYHHQDHLGSLVAQTPETVSTANDVTDFGYDAWGARRDEQWNGLLGSYVDHIDNTNKGFTGHEHFGRFGIVHMNGRAYDPFFGRFISPDPLIQAPEDTQSYNRYSYVFNNPLSNRDPSGYACINGHSIG